MVPYDFFEAQDEAVYPNESRFDASAPLLTRRVHTSIAPAAAACINGVAPLLSTTSTRHLRFNNALTASRFPAAAATCSGRKPVFLQQQPANHPEALVLDGVVDRADLLDALRNPSLFSAYADPTVPTDLRLEGTLFPATYDVAEEDVADEARFLQRMADTFDQRYENLLGEVGRDPAILELGLSDYEVIVIASMIEREARVDVDRPLMARAIYNRLAQGMPLQIDATVYYAAGKSFTETLFQSELDAESPWNTYTTPGIPPTPIAAPGEAALRAALAPAEGEMIFWARTDENGIVGAHAFSATLVEHNQAVARCRELGYCG